MKHPSIHSVIAVILLSSVSIWAQISASANLPVTATIVKGLNLSSIKGDLDFGEIILNDVSTSLNKTPNDGLLLEVSGNSGRSVIVEYSDINLTGKVPDLNSTETPGSLTFRPIVESGSTSNYSNTRELTNGGDITLTGNNGNGFQYLWIGGNLEINSNALQGEYQGEFVLTVAY